MTIRTLAPLCLGLALLAGCGAPVATRSGPSASPTDLGSASPSRDASSAPEGSTPEADEAEPQANASSPSSKRAREGHHVEGRVTDGAGEPVQGICVDQRYDDEGTWHMKRSVAKTDEDGRFEASTEFPTPEWGFTLLFRDCRPTPTLAFEWYDDVTSHTVATILKANMDHSVRVSLGRGASLSGTVIGDGGEAAEGICVRLYDGSVFDDGTQETLTPYATVETDEDGSYRFRGLAAKTYNVYFDAGANWSSDCSGGRYASEFYDDKPFNPWGTDDWDWDQLPPSDDIELGEGAHRTIDATLGPCTNEEYCAR